MLEGPLADRVRQAFADRDEIFRRLESLSGALPAAQRDEISRSAIALADKVQSLAGAADETARMGVTGAREHLEGEILTLEEAANPLGPEGAGRARRLADPNRQAR